MISSVELPNYILSKALLSTKSLNGKSRQSFRIVSLAGGSGQKAEESPDEVAFKFADALKAPCYCISAYAIVDSSADRSILITGKSVNHTLNIAKSSDSAVLDIGNADKDSTLVLLFIITVTY